MRHRGPKKCECVQSVAARGFEDGIEEADPDCLICEGTGEVVNEACDECGHAMKYHRAEYGCEVERGDGYVGTSDVLQALGPCGCTAAVKE